MKGFLKEFEDFAVKGNAVDLAVGVVIGAAFGQVTTALSNGIITPPVSLLLGGTDFERLVIPIGGGASIAFGTFLQACINFILIALALFFMVKLFGRLTRRRREEQKKPAENPELRVLMEIRDELREGPAKRR